MADHLVAFLKPRVPFLALQTEQCENQSGWSQVQLAEITVLLQSLIAMQKCGPKMAGRTVCSYGWVHVCIWACMHVSASSSESAIPPLETVSSWPGAHQLGWTGQWASRNCLSQSPAAVFQSAYHHTWQVYVGFDDQIWVHVSSEQAFYH